MSELKHSVNLFDCQAELDIQFEQFVVDHVVSLVNFSRSLDSSASVDLNVPALHGLYFPKECLEAEIVHLGRVCDVQKSYAVRKDDNS